MDMSKPWYQSRTIWASAVAVASSLAALFGHSVSGPDAGTLADSLLQIVTAASSVAAVVGRVAATKKVH